MRPNHTHDKSWNTHDRGPPGPGRPEPPEREDRFLTNEKLGPKRELMKNGFLVCYDVPLSRTGWMLYGPGQVPVDPNPTSVSVYVERTADELFSHETMLSFEGIGLVNDHPDFDEHPDGLTVDNAQDLAGGYVMNVRRGEGPDSDVLLGDIVVTRKDFIEAIMSGKREISAGYDATYETLRPGFGRQHNIVANHIALVGTGRCGPRCAIGDHATTTEEEPFMADKQPGAPGARRRVDAAALDAIEEMVQTQRARMTGDAEDEGIHVHVHTGPTPTRDRKDGDDEGEDRIGKVEKMVGDLANTVTTLGESLKSYMTGDRRKTKDDDQVDPDDDEEDMDDEGEGSTATKDSKKKKTKDDDKDDKEKKTGDSAALSASYQDLVSKAEILVPGFQVPTFDASQPRKMTVDSMCSLRRKALEQFGATDDGKTSLVAIVGDSAIDKMACESVAVVFNAAAAAKASANNARTARVGDAAVVQQHTGGTAPVSVAQLESALRKYWADQRP